MATLFYQKWKDWCWRSINLHYR